MEIVEITKMWAKYQCFELQFFANILIIINYTATTNTQLLCLCQKQVSILLSKAAEVKSDYKMFFDRAAPVIDKCKENSGEAIHFFFL